MLETNDCDDCWIDEGLLFNELINRAHAMLIARTATYHPDFDVNDELLEEFVPAYLESDFS